MKNLTSFGKLIEGYRTKVKSISDKELAEGLQCSDLFLEKLKTGRKGISDKMVKRVIAFFNLDEYETKALMLAVENSPAKKPIEKSEERFTKKITSSFNSKKY